MSYALKIMGIRDYFKVELIRKLETKCGKGNYDDIIDQLTDWGYLNDERATKQYIRSKLNASYGEYYIKAKLAERGVYVDTADILTTVAEENIDIEEHIKKLAEKYIEANYEDAYKQFCKCMSYLQKRGYTIADCMRVIKKGDFEK